MGVVTTASINILYNLSAPAALRFLDKLLKLFVKAVYLIVIFLVESTAVRM